MLPSRAVPIGHRIFRFSITEFKNMRVSSLASENARGLEIRVSVCGTGAVSQFCRKLRRGQTCKWRCLRAGVKLASTPYRAFRWLWFLDFDVFFISPSPVVHVSFFAVFVLVYMVPIRCFRR